MKNIVLFDLDGTITDPAEGITGGVYYALKKFGITPPPKDELKEFIGPPMVQTFMRVYGVTEEHAVKLLHYYREYYAPKGIFECHLYDGIEDTIKELKRMGKMILLATSKPDVYSSQIMEHFGLLEYLDFLAASTMDEKRVKKGDVIAYGLSECRLDGRRDECVMVGDRSYDIIGAKENGIASVGVTYGYGSREELMSANPDYLADSPEELLKIIKEI